MKFSTILSCIFLLTQTWVSMGFKMEINALADMNYWCTHLYDARNVTPDLQYFESGSMDDECQATFLNWTAPRIDDFWLPKLYDILREKSGETLTRLLEIQASPACANWNQMQNCVQLQIRSRGRCLRGQYYIAEFLSDLAIACSSDLLKLMQKFVDNNGPACFKNNKVEMERQRDACVQSQGAQQRTMLGYWSCYLTTYDQLCGVKVGDTMRDMAFLKFQIESGLGLVAVRLAPNLFGGYS